MCFGGGGDRQVDNDLSSIRNREVEKQLAADKRAAEKTIKILLLGAGESGKSTVLKQMRLIYASGFNVRERKQWRSVAFNNIVTSLAQMVQKMEEDEIPLANPANQYNSELVKAEPDIDIDQPLPREYLDVFKTLWEDAGIQQAVIRGNEYAMQDNLSYFFNDLDRLFQPDYLPSDQDILRARQRTIGITEETFRLQEYTYKLFDVGGQRSERRKWIHVFDSVHVVLFLAAISAYDYVLFEDRDENQMVEALNLFEAISNSPWFVNSSIILFLNKMDLFKQKVSTGRVPISKYFSHYTGPETDVEAGKRFFEQEFRKQYRNARKEMYVHYTNATDTSLLRVTMNDVSDMIVQGNLNELVL